MARWAARSTGAPVRAAAKTASKATPRNPKTVEQRSEIRDGMRVDWDVPIEMDDGVVLRADVFRPRRAGTYPVIITCGPYAKGLAWQDALYVKSRPEEHTSDIPTLMRTSYADF